MNPSKLKIVRVPGGSRFFCWHVARIDEDTGEAELLTQGMTWENAEHSLGQMRAAPGLVSACC